MGTEKGLRSRSRELMLIYNSAPTKSTDEIILSLSFIFQFFEILTADFILKLAFIPDFD